jgi:hypothetical protein
MTFYVKRSEAAEIEGPFAIEQINQMVRQKKFASDSLAIAATRQDLPEAQDTPSNLWIRLTDLPGFEPGPVEERRSVLVILLIIAFMVLLPVAALIMLVILLNRIH